MGRPSKYKPEYCESLIEHMTKGYSFESFSKIAKVCVDTLYDWQRAHPDFKEAHSVGKGAALHAYETIMLAKMRGQDLGSLEAKNMDTTLIIFTGKTRFHKVYGEKKQIDHTSSDGSLSEGLTAHQKKNLAKLLQDEDD